MSFANVTVASIVGNAISGAQAMFPRFTFDEESKPSLEQVQKFAASAINQVTRAIRFKGYDPTVISDPVQNATVTEDMLFITDWMELEVCAAVISVLDSFKDNKVYNSRLEQLQVTRRGFQTAEDPFPSVPRSTSSETSTQYPSRMRRVGRRDGGIRLSTPGCDRDRDFR